MFLYDFRMPLVIVPHAVHSLKLSKLQFWFRGLLYPTLSFVGNYLISAPSASRIYVAADRVILATSQSQRRWGFLLFRTTFNRYLTLAALVMAFTLLESIWKSIHRNSTQVVGRRFTKQLSPFLRTYLNNRQRQYLFYPSLWDTNSHGLRSLFETSVANTICSLLFYLGYTITFTGDLNLQNLDPRLSILPFGISLQILPYPRSLTRPYQQGFPCILGCRGFRSSPEFDVYAARVEGPTSTLLHEESCPLVSGITSSFRSGQFGFLSFFSFIDFWPATTFVTSHVPSGRFILRLLPRIGAGHHRRPWCRQLAIVFIGAWVLSLNLLLLLCEHFFLVYPGQCTSSQVVVVLSIQGYGGQRLSNPLFKVNE